MSVRGDQARRSTRSWRRVVEQGLPTCTLVDIGGWNQSVYTPQQYMALAAWWREIRRNRQRAPWRRGTWA